MNHVFMVPGLGAEAPGMANTLYETSLAFKNSVDSTTAIVESITGSSLLPLLTQRTSKPASNWTTMELHLVNVAYSLGAVEHAKSLGYQADGFLGCSLGELVAAILARALSTEDGINMAIQQAELFDQYAPKGGFLSVVGKIEEFELYRDCLEGTWIAADNCQSNYVVSGGIAEIEYSQLELEKRDVYSVRLAIGEPYHSPLIEPLRTKVQSVFNQTNNAKITLFSASQCGEIEIVDARSLWRAVREKIQFRKLIELITSKEPVEFIDCSPNGYLSHFVQAITNGEHNAVIISDL